tara:strand:+ start:5169 stop:5663 length:495 start_codon:yes stop_codon:yes gene_type:complete
MYEFKKLNEDGKQYWALSTDADDLKSILEVFKKFLLASGFDISHDEELRFAKPIKSQKEDVDIELPDEQIRFLMELAHEKDVTLNEVISDILLGHISTVAFDNFVDNLEGQKTEGPLSPKDVLKKIDDIQSAKEKIVSCETISREKIAFPPKLKDDNNKDIFKV